ncbi:MAG: hypothetical protein NVS2B4_22950 [Ramlibacter sp.]
MDAVLLLLCALGVFGLVAGTLGSLKRNRGFQSRYRAASDAERRELEKIRPRSLSWTWVNSHLKPKWAIAMYVFLALVVIAAWWLRR